MFSFHSGLLTSKSMIEAQFIYIYIFKFIICKPKLKVNLGVGASEKKFKRTVDSWKKNTEILFVFSFDCIDFTFEKKCTKVY